MRLDHIYFALYKYYLSSSRSIIWRSRESETQRYSGVHATTSASQEMSARVLGLLKLDHMQTRWVVQCQDAYARTMLAWSCGRWEGAAQVLNVCVCIAATEWLVDQLVVAWPRMNVFNIKACNLVVYFRSWTREKGQLCVKAIYQWQNIRLFFFPKCYLPMTKPIV
jgi:hypothetical protein